VSSAERDPTSLYSVRQINLASSAGFKAHFNIVTYLLTAPQGCEADHGESHHRVHPAHQTHQHGSHSNSLSST